MGRPASQLNVNRLITQFALDFKPFQFQAENLFPGVQVKKTVGSFIEYDREWKRRADTGAEITLRAKPSEVASIIRTGGSTGV